MRTCIGCQQPIRRDERAVSTTHGPAHDDPGCAQAWCERHPEARGRVPGQAVRS